MAKEIPFVEVAKQENQIPARTRDYLLPKLPSGEVELKAVEKEVEAVA